MADNYDFIWRLLSRLNVPRDEVDDAAQQVFMVLVARQELVLEPGKERSFLFGVALRTAQEFRRRAAVQHARSGTQADSLHDPTLGAEELTEQLEARRTLDQILERMPEPMRLVFVLFELEGLSAREISELTKTPAGTVASRLRRARELFQADVARLREQKAGSGAR